MSGKRVYRRRITVGGKTYVPGPLLPPGEDKHRHCAGSALGKCFGHECLHIEGLYWVEKAESSPAAEHGARLVTCVKCGKRRRSDRFDQVITSDSGATESWCHECAENGTAICEYCGRVTLSGLLGRVTGSGMWCPECRRSHSSVCARCGKTVRSGSIKRVKTREGYELWCDECRSGHTRMCGYCHTLAADTVTVSVDSESWCEDCASLHAAVCSVCGRRTGGIAVPEDGARLCRNCRERKTGDLILMYHGMRGVTPVFWGAGPLFMGFELEAGGAGSDSAYMCAAAVNKFDPDRRHFHMERDASIPENGFELVAAPHTLDEHRKFAWADIVRTMSSHGLKSHDCGGKCGLHVHVSRAALSPADLVNIDAFVLRNKTFWERVARRTQSEYAKYVNKPDSMLGNCSERYCAVNFRNSDTVEFRLFRGTLRHKTLMATLEIVDGLCRWVKTRVTDQILRNEGEVDNFAAWLADSDRGGAYANAVEYISMRRAVEDANSGVSDVASPDV